MAFGLVLVALFVVPLLLWASTGGYQKKPGSGLPRLGKTPGPSQVQLWWARWDWYRNGHQMVIRALSQTRDAAFVVQTMTGDTTVLSAKYLSELNTLPESRLSSTVALVDSVMGAHTGIDILLQGHLTSEICRGPLVKHLPTLIPLMHEEAENAISEQLGKCSVANAQTVVAHDFLYGIIHRVSSLVFVGKAFCYNPIWTDAVTALPIDVEITKLILLPVPESLRGLLSRLIPQRHAIFRHRAAVCRLLFPPGRPLDSPSEISVLKLLIDNGKDLSPQNITARLLVLTAAALHTSSMAMTHATFDLCVRPEYVEPLRLEARRALDTAGGRWSSGAIKELKLLDSFLKESQRLNQSTFLGFDRKVMSPVTLSDHETPLPAGTSIAISGWHMARDPRFYEDPDVFDGYRFYTPTEARSTYTDIEPRNLSWGSGRFTCPGRWYGAALIKMLFADMLLRYDIALADRASGRPENSKYDTEIHPDFAARIVLRRREERGGG